MVQSKPRFSTFDEYLSYDDGMDKLYELFNGELVEVPPESGINVQIANRLFFVFALLLSTDQVRGHGLELEVRGEPRNRYPDLTIIREEHVQQLARRNTIRLSMAPPLLVVEVVSPGELQRALCEIPARGRDYVAKRRQYEDLGVPEYWIVDPEAQTVTILELQGADYIEAGTFRGGDPCGICEAARILAPTFPELDLTADQVFTAAQ